MIGSADLATRLHAWATGGAGAASAALCTDLDGTLSPIVDDPAAARPLPGAAGVLAALAKQLGVVAVVSGRPAAYLRNQLGGAGGVRLVGLYGLEQVVDGEVVASEEAQRWWDTVAAEADAAERWAAPGVTVERKGASVTLHSRSAPQHASEVERYVAARAAATGLVAHPGKASIELRPPGGGDKGDAVASLVSGLEAVAFLGDDVGDLPAFATLGRLGAAGVRTLSVGVGGDEAPAGVLEAADVVVEGPEAVLAGLAGLLAALAR